MQIQIVNLERNLPEGLCTVAHWTASQVDGEFTASAYGSLSLPAKDPSDPTFVPYADITEAQAIEWTKNVMGEEAVAALENKLNSQINEYIQPKKANGTPWVYLNEDEHSLGEIVKEE